MAQDEAMASLWRADLPSCDGVGRRSPAPEVAVRRSCVSICFPLFDLRMKESSSLQGILRLAYCQQFPLLSPTHFSWRRELVLDPFRPIG